MTIAVLMFVSLGTQMVTITPYLHPSLPTYLPPYLPTSLPTYLPTYLPTSLPTYLPNNQPTNLPTYLPPSLPTYLPTNQLTFLPAYLHRWASKVGKTVSLEMFLKFWFVRVKVRIVFKNSFSFY